MTEIIDQLNTQDEIVCFSSAVYKRHKPEFLEAIKRPTTEHLNRSKLDFQKSFNHAFGEKIPYYASYNFAGDERYSDFEFYILQTSREILVNQGYDVGYYNLRVQDLWCQEHNKNSGQDTHIHPNCVISGFYFTSVPQDVVSPVNFHDPRPAKVFGDLIRLQDESSHIRIVPEVGMFVFTNSWLPHQFERNLSTQPLRFLHFNVMAELVTTERSPVDIV